MPSHRAQKSCACEVGLLESIYNLLQQEQTNRWMFVLETAIVALFLLDLAALFLWHRT